MGKEHDFRTGAWAFPSKPAPSNRYTVDSQLTSACRERWMLGKCGQTLHGPELKHLAQEFESAGCLHAGEQRAYCLLHATNVGHTNHFEFFSSRVKKTKQTQVKSI